MSEIKIKLESEGISENICRVCMAKDPPVLVPLFTATYNSHNAAEMIQFISGVQVIF